MCSGNDVKGTLVLRFSDADGRRIAVGEAADILREGGLVAFPTETVYGLGAAVFNTDALNCLFRAKKRPSDNPLIVHIHDFSQLASLAADIPPAAGVLARAFWPGPLTIVVKRAPAVPDAVSAGLETVAVRMPAHPLALELIRTTGVPLVAPSANISGRPSPTEAAHVIEDLAGRIDAVIDDGQCLLGIESTVLDLTAPEPTLLRPGGVDLEKIEECLGCPVVKDASNNDAPSPSPGMKYRHYSPGARLILFTGGGSQAAENMLLLYSEYLGQGKKMGIICFRDNVSLFPRAMVESLGDRNNLAEAAAALYRAMRHLDRCGVDVIMAEGCTRKGPGLALMNRLSKASSEIVEGKQQNK